MAKEAFQCVDVHVDLSMRTAGMLDDWRLSEYQEEYPLVLKTLTSGLESGILHGGGKMVQGQPIPLLSGSYCCT